MVTKKAIGNAALSVFIVLGWGMTVSAMYDPMLGRFASRDPIGYVDGVNQYSSRFASGYVDPFGETAIRVGKLNVDLPKTCGSSNSVRWTFKVDKTGDNRSGPCANGYEGYLIQFVEQWCFKKDCKTCDNCPKPEDRTDWFLSEGFPSEAAEHFSYYEAWNVTKAGNVIDISNFTDKAMVDVKNETCGFTNQIGTIRFYCKEDVSLNGWHPGSNNLGSAAYYGKICPTTPLALPSIGGEAPPGFWGTPPIAEAPAQPDDIGVLQAGRFLFSDWDCCDPDKWVTIEYGPKKSL